MAHRTDAAGGQRNGIAFVTSKIENKNADVSCFGDKLSPCHFSAIWKQLKHVVITVDFICRLFFKKQKNESPFKL